MLLGGRFYQLTTEVLSSMQFLRQATTLWLAIYMDPGDDLCDDPILQVSDICSDVAVLELGVPTENLTLPHLAQLIILEFFRYDFISWPHAEFLDMARRSELASHLTKLDIAICLVEDEEVVDILSMTRMLQESCIADHSFLTWEHIVLTNPLLEWLSQSELVLPRLGFG
ncbi:hypothetical protein R3P38DRAFT_3183014 [Favolaschia claudopus]|uniref:Uncharacterized protein n=1 Tax=Favolaschia claudopus TaxID=2862362 RepID=A0AAW0CDE5_9AGAR